VLAVCLDLLRVVCWVGRAYLERCKPPEVACGRHCGCCCDADELCLVVLQWVVLLQEEERKRKRRRQRQKPRTNANNTDDGTTTLHLHVKEQCSWAFGSALSGLEALLRHVQCRRNSYGLLILRVLDLPMCFCRFAVLHWGHCVYTCCRYQTNTRRSRSRKHETRHLEGRVQAQMTSSGGSYRNHSMG